MPLNTVIPVTSLRTGFRALAGISTISCVNISPFLAKGDTLVKFFSDSLSNIFRKKVSSANTVGKPDYVLLLSSISLK